MQEYVEERTIAISVKAAKLSGTMVTNMPFDRWFLFCLIMR